MVASRDRKHLLVPNKPRSESYRPHAKGFSPKNYPSPPDRRAHADFLGQSFDQIQKDSEARRGVESVFVPSSTPGITVEFESPPSLELKLESLDNKKQKIELLNVRPSGHKDDAPVQRATVFIPDGSLEHFSKCLHQYAEEKTKKGDPRHKDFIDRIASVHKADLKALWTDAEDSYPSDDREKIWWEVWLRRHDDCELERFLAFSGQVDLVVGERRLGFNDRIVILVEGTIAQLSASLDVLNDIAELRLAKVSATFFVDDLDPCGQVEWADDLRRRVSLTDDHEMAICVLDTGVNHQHPLLKDVCSAHEAMAVAPNWKSHDRHSHGTQMAGLAAYGDLSCALESKELISVPHRIESVKILPDVGVNPPELYGTVTAQAVHLSEASSPHRRRIFSMSVTANDQRDRGQPTSWSAAIDALASGQYFDPSNQKISFHEDEIKNTRRLFILCSGNVDDRKLSGFVDGQLTEGYLDICDLETIQDPAHSWNALTVGAYTDKSTHSGGDDFRPLAPHGELSPWSATSVTFQDSWPLKPDVVYEGGNALWNGRYTTTHPETSLLSIHHKPAEKMFSLTCATSAATAQVARLAAMVSVEYPQLWPESIRALIVQSARWTDAMKKHFHGCNTKRDRVRLIRRYGYGVPSLNRALRSANDALTLVLQAGICPFEKGQMREMNLHELPWPKDVLAGLGGQTVHLRVTLSYFIEPNPGRRGWKNRHRYASHGLRFDVKKPLESLDEFRKRLNQKALGEEESRPDPSREIKGGWYIGEARNKGSIHSDIWSGSASDLAECGIIGVYPVTGWWKEQLGRDRSATARYALVVSIETESEDVDIWTPVAQEIGVFVEV